MKAMLGWRRDEKRFIDEILLRMERSERRTVVEWKRVDESLRKLNAKMDQQLRESREEYEAHRGTLLAILDRLDLIDPRDGPPHPSQA